MARFYFQKMFEVNEMGQGKVTAEITDFGDDKSFLGKCFLPSICYYPSFDSNKKRML